MNDWIGLLFFVILISGAYFGLKVLAKPQNRTEKEFEKKAAESASMLGASMTALQELLNPEVVKAKGIQTQLKEGRYNKKKREGKANGTEGENDEPESN